MADKVQDLSPVALRFLSHLAKDPARLYLTADAGLSIYASGFAWRAVDEALAMSGRSRVLKRDYSTTRPVHAAVRDLAAGLGLDLAEFTEPGMRDGPTPRVVPARTAPEEACEHLARVLRATCRELRLPLGIAAVLPPPLPPVVDWVNSHGGPWSGGSSSSCPSTASPAIRHGTPARTPTIPRSRS